MKETDWPRGVDQGFILVILSQMSTRFQSGGIK